MRKSIVGCFLTTVVLCCLAIPAQALMLSNPDWEIELTDFGYSDVLYDRTPGREGREYLSGEWAAALGYKVELSPVTTPIWLEPDFLFPDWTTNSNFAAFASISPGPLNGDGLPTAMSIVENPDLRIEIDYEMLDTVTGIAQGTVPASLGGSGASVISNRYILKQTYTIEVSE